jgi:hypothetical protein
MTACQTQRTTDGETEKRTAIIESKPLVREKDSWQRTKDCAEQTERFAKAKGWFEGKTKGETTIISWENHYSAKYQGCYVKINYWVNSRDLKLPSHYYEFWDAFEGKFLSRCNDAQQRQASGILCTVQSREDSENVNCGMCRDFVRDRMNH